MAIIIEEEDVGRLLHKLEGALGIIKGYLDITKAVQDTDIQAYRGAASTSLEKSYAYISKLNEKLAER
jgi:hypothetical protein